MQKFINLSNEKHSRFAFELYDFNKDHYICTNDAFHAMSLDHTQIFNHDILKIRQAFVIKTNNELGDFRVLHNKKAKKNKAFMSAEDEVKFRVAAIHSSKPEALTLDDFMKISFFLGKPQIIQDLIKYLTDADLAEFNLETTKAQKRKKSEQIIEEMIFHPEFREKMMTDAKYPYYKELEKALVQLPQIHSAAIMDKYNSLNTDFPNKINEISLKSVIEVWPSFFGVNNKFISSSFFQYLAGPKHSNITKISFVNSLLLLFNV